MLRYTTDRARPGLVTLYDIRPGNGVGQFLQPRSPHRAKLIISSQVDILCVEQIYQNLTDTTVCQQWSSLVRHRSKWWNIV